MSSSFQCLSREEFLTHKDTPEELVNLVNKRYEEKCQQLASKECEVEAQNIEFDKVRNQLEKENNALKLRIQSQTENIDQLQSTIDNFKVSADATNTRHKNLTDDIDKKDKLISSLNVQINQLKESKISISQLTKEKDTHIANLDHHVSELNEKLKLLIEEKRDLNQIILDEQSKSVPLQFKYNELKQQNENIENHAKWLDTQLLQKKQELTQSSFEFRQKINALESQLNAVRNENSLLNQKYTQTHDRFQAQGEKLNQYIQKVKDLNMEKDSVESSLQDEALNQARVIQLYKSTNADLKAKIEKLSSDLQNAQSRYKHDMQEKDAQLQKWIKKCTDTNDEVAQLTVQLKKKQSEAQHSMTPLENVRSMLSEGLTSTHIYEKYVQASQDLIQLRAEKDSVEMALNDIMKELEAKRPVFQEQKEDYERLMTSYVLQTNKYQSALRENENCKQQLQKQTKQAHRVDDLIVENNNLSSQVSHLLQECLEYKRRLGAVRSNVSEGSGAGVEAQGDNEDTTSDYETNIITSEDLITFSDIEQLQKTNRELLKQIHRLKNERDQATKQMEDRLNTSYKEKLNEAMAEIEKLRKDRQAQLTNIKSIVKQRDMLRSLLAEMEKEKAHTTSQWSASEKDTDRKLSGASSDDRGPSSKEIRDLQMEYIESRKMLQEELDTERKTRLTAESTSQRLKAQLEDVEARLGMKEEHIMMANTEVTHLKETKDNLIQKLLSIQESLTKTYKKLEEKEELATTHRSTINNLRAQLNYSQERIERLLEEVNSFRKYKVAQEELSTQLREIQNKLETQFLQEKETTSALKEREKEKIHQFKTEIKSLQQRIEELQNEMFAERTKFAEQLSKRQEENSSLKEDRAKINAERESALKKIDDLTQQLKESEKRLTMLIHQYTVDEEAATEVSDEENTEASEQDQSPSTHRLRISLSAYKQEIEVKEERIRQLKLSIEEAQSLAKERETALHQVSETHEKFKVQMQAQLTKSEEEKTDLKKQLDELRDELAHTTNDLLEARQEHQSQQEQLQKSMQNEDSGNTVSAASLREAEERISKLKKDVEEEHQLFLESKKKYEAEVIEHGQAMEKARNLEQQLEKYRLDPQLSQNQQVALESLRAEASTWEALENSLRQQMKELTERVDREVEQKNSLYTEIEKMTVEIEKLRTGESATEDDSQANKHIVELREIVRHLRREKDISQTQLQSEEKKSQILQMRYESIKKELEEKNAQIQEMKQQERPMAEEEYNTRKQLMRDLSVYQESNSTLRLQTEKLQARCDTLTAEVSSLKEEISPLQQKIEQQLTQLGSRQKEIEQLRRTADNWKKRVEGLLKKDTRIDPEEFESLKTSKASLEKEKQELSEKLRLMESDITKLQDIERKSESFKELSAKYKQEKQKLEEQMKKLQEDIQKRDEAASEASQAHALGVARKHKQEVKKLQKKISSLTTELEQERSKQKEDSAAREEKYKGAINKLKTMYQDAKTKNKGLETELESLREQLAEQPEESVEEAEMEEAETASAEEETEDAAPTEEEATTALVETSPHAGQKRKHADVVENSEPPLKKTRLTSSTEEEFTQGSEDGEAPAEVSEEETQADEEATEIAPTTPAVEEAAEEETHAEDEEVAGEESEDEGSEEEEEETPTPVQPIIMTSRDKIPSSKPRKIQRPKFGQKK
eukprot:CAMPEP_0117442370 /NCGR_PEP_ID=MMETSP0759-20121206/4114_1 /TAXON_ID=63605 /ORGANISM="Percolomonas cosmopolitus, Strain WS" /LENGTH=1670 /DNA_ID=CAMNT_0005234251 /DNA_START=11 /DNA_END=5023 /DNA_ORIENTATION=-